MSIAHFQSFRDLLLHCLKCHDSGDSQQALAVIDKYLADSRAERPADAFWSEYNVQQALGFRVAFTGKVSPASAPAGREAPHVLQAPAELLAQCRGRVLGPVSASAV
jgi:hypothetical protein